MKVVHAFTSAVCIAFTAKDTVPTDLIFARRWDSRDCAGLDRASGIQTGARALDLRLLFFNY